MNDSVIKVLIVDDSAYNRRTISGMLRTCPYLSVVGTAMNGEDALKKVMDLRPDIITLDLEMPKMDGFTFLRIMMKNFPTPTIVISSRSEDKSVFKALEFGAVDFIAKPTDHISTEILKIKDELIAKVVMVSEMNLERLKDAMVSEAVPIGVVPKPGLVGDEDFYVIALGASTGGPVAIRTVLSKIPPEVPAAIVISQHMPPGFTMSFAERLNKVSALRVREAMDGLLIRASNVLLSPGGFHMSFDEQAGRVRTKIVQGGYDKYVPSIDRMFISVAEVFGPRAIGVVMTGMGSDGKEGIRRIKEAGGSTIAQNEESSLIYGMPREAISTGKVDRVVPLGDIAGVVALMAGMEFGAARNATATKA